MGSVMFCRAFALICFAVLVAFDCFTICAKSGNLLSALVPIAVACLPLLYMREAIADLDGLDLAVDTAVRAAMAAPKPISPELREKKRRAVAVRWERERARKAAAGKVAR